MPPFPGFAHGLVDAVKLQELPVALTDFLFDVAVPEIRGEAERAVRLFIDGDVVGAFQPDDVVAFDSVLVIAPGFGVLEQG